MRFGCWKWESKVVVLSEMELVVACGELGVAMDGDSRTSTAGDALLMGSALDVVIQQARAGPCGRRYWFGWLSEAGVILLHALPSPSGALARQVDLAHHNTPSQSL